MRVFCLIILPFLFCCTVAVLDSYLALEGNVVNDRDSIIENYFNAGYKYCEILAFLIAYHGINISLRQLKRILNTKGLRRRKHPSDLEDVINVIEREIQGSGSCIGYRTMWQRLRTDYKLVVSQNTVRLALKLIDPDGVTRRRKHRLQRRRYKARGPNHLWHLDGYDKLKPFGFCIHGCIDGYSRRIMWLEVGTTNNNPRVIAKYFIDCVRQVQGTASIVRADRGTENVKVAGIQRFLRRNDTDSFSGNSSFMYGKSVSNQRIEAWWSQLRKGCTEWWINYFKDLRDRGLYCDADIINVECLKFCYMPVIQDELQRVARLWNSHRIRPSTNQDSPPGKPDMLYYLSTTIEDAEECKHAVDTTELDIAEELCCFDISNTESYVQFTHLATMIMNEQGLNHPRSPEMAEDLYMRLLTEIEDILS